jgi:hypothetical protein
MAKKAAARRPSPRAVVAKVLTPVQDFIQTESASGVILIAAAALAFAGRARLGASYFAVLNVPRVSWRGAWRSRCCSGSATCSWRCSSS